jgi:hypothetical protein
MSEPEAGYDPMRQFAELAGDVRDPYPMFAGIRESAFDGDRHADLVPQLTFPFPVRVIGRILGLPEADWPRFFRLSTELIAVMRNWDRAVAAGQELRAYFAEIIADRRHMHDDLVSQLIEAEVDGHRLADEEIYPFLLLLLPPRRRPAHPRNAVPLAPEPAGPVRSRLNLRTPWCASGPWCARAPASPVRGPAAEQMGVVAPCCESQYGSGGTVL